ncbi:MAG: hypothetical protein KDA27_14555 [Candidatus Eisenbacteria bacterium]|uniref:Tetratricopeptide repeat protein n=1 Tax=Eiseniibacteriota bacterium TaxID=2212470 RepID=A0A956ND25_UNCEI|nr:hypothetical protein [Candidatus Eisenbacteria bacterium]MCB9462881.1 hypothetical protein [Candidatus Eisenbacteria bacterium]
MRRGLDRISWTSLVLGFALLAGGARLGRAVETALGEHTDGAELALFPRGELIRPFTFGKPEVAADLVWLRAIQYYGQHRGTDRSYPYAETLFDSLTDLDPTFINAYIFGALVLHEQFGRLEPALALLDKGIEANPDSYWLPFERGFFLYVTHWDREGAVAWLARAAEMEGAPDSYRRLAAFAAQQSGEREVAVALWLEVYTSTENEEIRKIAHDYLRDLGHPEFQDDPEGGGL